MKADVAPTGFPIFHGNGHLVRAPQLTGTDPKSGHQAGCMGRSTHACAHGGVYGGIAWTGIGEGDGEPLKKSGLRPTRPLMPEKQEKVFDPFYRGNQGKRFKQGMGLGLSIARHVVEAHGGTINLDSEPGMGSTFTIHLPATRIDPSLSSEKE